MERKSRIARYQELRDQMFETKMDSDENNNISVEELDEKPIYQPVREKVASAPDFKIDQFHNEYLDEFIREVKEYNIKKGNAVSQDTQVNVLKELISDEDARQEYVEEISQFSYFEDISKQVEALISEDMLEEMEEVESEESIKEDIASLQKEETAKIDSMNTDKDELLNQTRKIEIKMDEYKEDVAEISTKVNRTNFILNLIVAILIILIISVIILAIYYIAKVRG